MSDRGDHSYYSNHTHQKRHFDHSVHNRTSAEPKWWFNDNGEVSSSGYATYQSPADYYNTILALLCVAWAGIASGLTVGLLSLDTTKLEMKRKSKDSADGKAAALVLPLLKKHHLLLVTLLLFNAIAGEALPVFLESLVPPWLSVIVSVTLVLLFGEVLPQAYFTGPEQLQTSAKMIPFVKGLITFFYPLAYPISRLLDHVFGAEEESSVLPRNEIEALFTLQSPSYLRRHRSIKGKRLSTSSAASTDSHHSRKVTTPRRGEGIPLLSSGGSPGYYSAADSAISTPRSRSRTRISSRDIISISRTGSPYLAGDVLPDIEEGLIESSSPRELPRESSSSSASTFQPRYVFPSPSGNRLSTPRPSSSAFDAGTGTGAVGIPPLHPSSVKKSKSAGRKRILSGNSSSSKKPPQQSQKTTSGSNTSSRNRNGNGNDGSTSTLFSGVYNLVTGFVMSVGGGYKQIPESDSNRSLDGSFRSESSDQDQHSSRDSSRRVSHEDLSVTMTARRDSPRRVSSPVRFYDEEEGGGVGYGYHSDGEEEDGGSDEGDQDDEEEEEGENGGGVGLSHYEVKIITGMFSVSRTCVSSIMIPIDDMFMLSRSIFLDRPVVDSIWNSGYSRLPVYRKRDRRHIVGYLLVKSLVTVDPDAECKQQLREMPLLQPVFARPSMGLLELLDVFRESRSHLAMISEDPVETQRSLRAEMRPTGSAAVIGMVTFEDVIEQLLQGDIEDETDQQHVGENDDDAVTLMVDVMGKDVAAVVEGASITGTSPPLSDTSYVLSKVNISPRALTY